MYSASSRATATVNRELVHQDSLPVRLIGVGQLLTGMPSVLVKADPIS